MTSMSLVRKLRSLHLRGAQMAEREGLAAVRLVLRTRASRAPSPLRSVEPLLRLEAKSLNSRGLS